jgi:glutathione S-transferase
MTPPTQRLKIVLCEAGDPGIPGLESYSPYCLKVHRGLKYLGLPYWRRHGYPASFKKYHPTGQVPVLLYGDQAVGDSTDILRKLQELAGRTFHEGNDPRLAAEAFLWEEFADSVLSGFLLAARWADDANWPRTRNAILKDVPAPLRGLLGARLRGNIVRGLVARDVWRAGPQVCWRRFGEMLDALEARSPEQDFWLGTFSVADIGLFGMLHSIRQDITPSQRDQLSARPKLTRYLDRVDVATRGTPLTGTAPSPATAAS